MRGVDMHVHLPTGDWVCGCVGHYADSIERYFGSRPETTTVEDFVALYERLDLVGVLLGWDAQGKTLDNAEIASICEQSGGRFVGFGSVDPNREDALPRLEHLARASGCAGSSSTPRCRTSTRATIASCRSSTRPRSSA